MLYWFRTPPGVKVGRAALDEEAIRLIEQLNPGIEFDWTRILKGQGAPSTEPRPPVEARRQRPDSRRPQPPPQTPAPSRPVQPPAAAVPVPAQTAETPSVAAEPEPSIQAQAAGSIDELSQEVAATPESEIPTPAHARLGAKGVERLRARYAEILARISERTADPLRREELKQQADRLNPDSWVTGEEVVQGLEQYESIFALLREVIGQKRRRRRRGSRPRPAEPGGVSGDVVDTARTDASAGPDGGESLDSPADDEGGGDSAPGES